MNLTECNASRRSIRRFEEREIKASTIRRLIHSAIQATSACNMQAWKFIVVNKRENMNKLVNFGAAKWIANAPCGILVVYRNDVTINTVLYKDNFQSAAAAIQNMLLEATNLGLAACWICDLPRPKYVRKIFAIPREFDVSAYIALGYPGHDNSKLSLKHYGDEKKYNAHERKYSFEQVVCYDKFYSTNNDCTSMQIPKRKVVKRFWLKRKCFRNILFTDHMLKE